jgi:hypothetical protein
LQYAQGDSSLEQIFWGKLIWDWAVERSDERELRFKIVWSWLQMAPLELMIQNKFSKLWIQRLMPLQKEMIVVLSSENSEQWEVVHASKMKFNPVINSEKNKVRIPFYFTQAQKILYEWLDFSALSEERLVFKVKSNENKPFTLPGPSIPYIHHLSMIKGKNSEYFISAMAVPREEVWDWLVATFQQVEILSPGRWKKIYESVTKYKTGH